MIAVQLLSAAGLLLALWRLIAHDIKTNQNGNPASGGSARSSTLLDDGVNDGFTPPDDDTDFKDKFERTPNSASDDILKTMTQDETDHMHEFIRQKRKDGNKAPTSELLEEWREMLLNSRRKP